MGMIKLYLCAVTLIILHDILILVLSRNLLFDFLCGHTSNSKARRIWRQQGQRDKIFLGYLILYINDKDDVPKFKQYLRLYQICLWSILPQYTLLILFASFLTKFNQIIFVVIGIIIAIKIVLFLIVRLHSLLYGHGYVSKYKYKKGKRKK